MVMIFWVILVPYKKYPTQIYLSLLIYIYIYIYIYISYKSYKSYKDGGFNSVNCL